jgi:hypothetical protein
MGKIHSKELYNTFAIIRVLKSRLKVGGTCREIKMLGNPVERCHLGNRDVDERCR